MLTLTQAIDLVFYSLKNSKGGEIFVKKAPATKMINLARAYAELKTGKKNYPLEYIGIRAGEKIDEVLVSEEEMRHVQEKKDHFVIKREEEIDNSFVKKSTKFTEYGSGTITPLSIDELKLLMKKLKWVV
jgi:UDP-glucose 4-epimerase